MDKLLSNKLIILLLILPFLEPRGIGEMAYYLGGMWYYLDLIFTGLRYLSFLMIIFMAAYEFQKPSLIFLLIMIYECIILFSSQLNGNLTRGIFVNAITVFGACILTDFYMQRKEAFLFLKIVSDILEIFIIINFFTILLFPDGMYIDNRLWRENYFLGYKNLHIFVFLLYILTFSLRVYLMNEKYNYKYFGMLLLIFLSSLIGKSSTTLVVIFSLVLMAFLLRNKKLPRIASIFSAYICASIVSVLIIFYHFQNLFAYLIENVLKKNLTLTARTRIWDVCVQYIKKSPIIGNGAINFDDIFATWTVTQAHNQFVDVLLMGGGILLLFFTLIFAVESKRVSGIRNIQIHNMLLFVYIAYFILFLTEARRDSALMFIGFTVVYHIKSYFPDVGMTGIKRNRKRIRFVLRWR